MNRAVVIFIIATAWFSLCIGSVSLFDWDEINFAEAAREMLLTGKYREVQINFSVFWEKPPLFFWLQSLSMSLWGISERGARFPNTVVGGLTLSVLYLIGQYLTNKRNDDRSAAAPASFFSRRKNNNGGGSSFPLGWPLLYAGAWLPHLYFKSGIIDPLFNLFIFVGLWFWLLCYDALLQQKSSAKVYRYVLLSGICVGLGILTKGPVALLLSGLTPAAYIAWRSYENRKSKGKISANDTAAAVVATVTIRRLAIPAVLWVSTALFVGGLWLLWEINQNGTFFIREFIAYQIRLFSTPDAGHSQPIYYHFLVVLLGCFPLSLWALPAFFTSDKDTADTLDFRRFMLCLFWVVLLLFSIVKTKIVHYSSLSYLPLSYLAAWVLWRRNEGAKDIQRNDNDNVNSMAAAELPRWVWGLFVGIGLLWVLLLTGLPLVAYYKEGLYPFIKDKFALACLQTNVHWSGFEWLVGLGYGLVVALGIGLWRRGKVVQGIWAICLAGIVGVPLYLWAVVPRIEQYSQQPVITFCRQLAGRDAYVLPVGFKSYAHLFYGQIQPRNAVPKLEEALAGNLSKPVYFITKWNKTKGLDTLPDVRKLKTEGGFSFFVLDK